MIRSNKPSQPASLAGADRLLEPGIFAKTFQRSSVEEVFDAIAGAGLTVTQWNWACVPGFSSLPETVPDSVSSAIADAAARSGVRICAVSATFNIIDPAALEAGVSRLPGLARAARAIDCDLLTLCTGTRHPTDIWAYHPENRSRESWKSMISGLKQVIGAVKPYGVRLAIEPETANVVSDARSAELVWRELGPEAACLSVVLDGANLFRPPLDPRLHSAVIDDAVDRLGDWIGLAHAKDIADPGAAPCEPVRDHYTYVAAGSGILPYGRYIAALTRTEAALAAIRTGRRLPLLLHGLSEQEVPAAVAFLRREIRACSPVSVEPANALLYER